MVKEVRPARGRGPSVVIPRLEWLCYSTGKEGERKPLVSVFVDTEVLGRVYGRGTRWARQRRGSGRRKKNPAEAEAPSRVSLLPLTPTHNEDAVLQAAITINNSILPCVTAGFLLAVQPRPLTPSRKSSSRTTVLPPLQPRCLRDFASPSPPPPLFLLLVRSFRVPERERERENARDSPLIELPPARRSTGL